MWRRGIDVGLGTDGAASWGSLDIFQVAHIARVGQEAVWGTPWHFRGVTSGEQMLRVATNGGARALGLEGEIGSLEAGRKADLLIVGSGELDQMPYYDPRFVAANTVVGRDVRTVVIDGRVVMKDREILTIDVAELRARLAARRPALMERFEAEYGTLNTTVLFLGREYSDLGEGEAIRLSASQRFRHCPPYFIYSWMRSF